MTYKKTNFILSLFFLFLITFKLNAQQLTSDIKFHPPVSIPMFLSGNFAELRLNHFHSGIDIKTGGVIGQKIFAIENGYISRIKITPNGYGKSLYITHPNGYVSVYAHLNEFIHNIKEYVKKIQYNKKSYAIDVFPDKNELIVTKGQLIAFSGNTGRSSGPHLHFEIRYAHNQNPVNPLHFNFNIKDNIKPIINNIIFYPKDSNSLIHNECKKYSLKVIKDKNDNLIFKDTAAINIWGEFGLGVQAYDLLNNSRNKCGIYIIELYLDNILIYSHKLDEFSFQETRYINSLLDFEAKIKYKKNIHKIFIDPNNQFNLNGSTKNSGIIDFTDNKKHEILLVLKDAYLNTSSIRFNVFSKEQERKFQIPEKKYTEAFSYNTKNIFERYDIKIDFPKNSFYDSIYFKYAMTPPLKSTCSYIHHIHNIYTPVHKHFTLSLRAHNLPDSLRDKALITLINNENKFKGLGGEWNNDFITTTTNSFGMYAIVIDSIPPEIIPINLKHGVKNLTKYKSIRFKITDDLSGIKSYNGFIDNKWVLFEYDAKNDLIYYIFDNTISYQENHELELYIMDNKNNISVFHSKFYK